MGKEGASNLVSLLSKSLEPVVDMHNNDCVICSCGYSWFAKPSTAVSLYVYMLPSKALIITRRKMSGL